MDYAVMLQTLSGASRSKTIWLGLSVTVLGYLQANINIISHWVDPKYLGLANMLLGLAIIVVRFYTDTALADK